jgi:hypothetical protein
MVWHKAECVNAACKLIDFQQKTTDLVADYLLRGGSVYRGYMSQGSRLVEAKTITFGFVRLK